MDNKEKYYKEVIKNRMYKNAASLWGVRNIDNFDPLIKLLIEALASEINKLSTEINNIEIRLLERIAALLTPDILMTVRPAHMIIHAEPLDKEITISKHTGFYYENISRENIHFYSAGKFSLLKGRVKSLICSDKLYSIDTDQSKQMQVKSLSRSAVFTNNLWIGLDLDTSIKSVHDLPFYMDILNIENKNELLHLLPYTQWSLEGKPLRVKTGISSLQTGEEPGRNTPFSTYDLANISDESITRIYEHQFITVTSEIENTAVNRKKLPDELKKAFRLEAIEDTLHPLLWIKVSFPPNFDDYILESFFVSINAFPVINKKVISKHFKTSKITSVIPLETDDNEYVLSVESVFDSKDQVYKPLPYQDENNRFGTYVLKRGGVERFDSRNAKEYISNLIDILREEGASFSMIGRGFVDELVAKINEQLVSIEKKMREINVTKDITSYMIIDADDIGDSVYIDYWLTNCERANDIKTGAGLFPFTDTPIEPTSVMSLTQSYGGRRLQTKNSLELYKYILTSRDRIYTDEDIVNCCLAHFGDLLTGAVVKKGVQVSPRPKEGLIRCMDVYITLRNHLVTLSSGREIKDKVENLLKEKSPDSYNYRIFISKQ